MQTVCQDPRARMFLMQRLSVAMQRGNAACILGTIADDNFSIEFFVGLFRPLYLYSMFVSNININICSIKLKWDGKTTEMW